MLQKESALASENHSMIYTNDGRIALAHTRLEDVERLAIRKEEQTMRDLLTY